ncbi:MAG: T9SS type A sorting domain-containing protein [Chitinophagales bacterium]|nr:T9SS type A sorting domain-containing protein [Chitinophagales bacterium]
MRIFFKATVFICNVFFTSMVNAQAPAIEWQNTIGGTGYEFLYFAEQTTDGGYILGGYSISGISSDKAEESIGAEDYWVVKLNAAGDVEWENTIGGGNTDFLWTMDQTADGGFILGGRSISGGGVGDKSESKIGNDDYWVVKLNAAGVVEWENTIGGLGYDLLFTVSQTIDGGYIIGGTSDSNISGDKTEARVGNTDIWVLKLNSSGSIVWQNDIGGLMNENIYSIEETQDGGFIIGGYSDSGISGDKTEANIGFTDYWVVKLDSAGGVVWDNTIGGSSGDQLYSLQETDDGSYIVAGVSSSGISGDKTEVSKGGSDYWIMKLSTSGSIIWQKTYGGLGSDLLYSNSITQTNDGGYIVGGYSISGNGGDKTEANNGSWDSWILKLDGAGNIEWQNTIGGPGSDYIFTAQQTQDGGYILGGYSYSGIGGDKTEANIGDADYWVIKLEGNCLLATEICNGIDDDCNGMVDDGVTVSISITTSGPTIFCTGGSVTLNAVHTGISLQWKKNGVNIAGATNSAYTIKKKGTYSCESMSVCGSALSDGYVITVNKNPIAGITAGGPTTFCEGDSVLLTASTGSGLSYQWFKGSTELANATSSSYSAKLQGKYNCLITKNSTGCSSTSNKITVTIPCKTGTASFADVSVYPNPATTFVTIETNSIASKTISIQNALGQTLRFFHATDEIIHLNIESLPAGVYSIQISNGENVTSQKFIKQ